MRLERPPARERQQALGEGGAAIGGVERTLGQALQVYSIGEPLLEQLEVDDDHRQMVVEIVGDPASQLAHCLHLMHLLEGGLDPFAVRHITQGGDELLGEQHLAHRRSVYVGRRKTRSTSARSLGLPHTRSANGFENEVNSRKLRRRPRRRCRPDCRCRR